MIGPLLMITTTFELSAQNPHSMKGLPVEVFFTTRGLFQFHHYSLFSQASMGQWEDDREPSSH